MQLIYLFKMTKHKINHNISNIFKYVLTHRVKMVVFQYKTTLI